MNDFLSNKLIGVGTRILRMLSSTPSGCKVANEIAESYLQWHLSKHYRFDRISPPNIKLEKFEDLYWLFHLSPTNRGILRLDLDEARLCYKYCQRIKKGRVLEIGRYTGGSTLLIAASIGDEASLVSIDICPQNDLELTKVLKKYGVAQRVQLIIQDANKVIIPDTFGLIFIDGDHSYQGAKRDFSKWHNQLDEEGYLIFHDAWPGRENATCFEEVYKLLQEILSEHGYDLVELCGSMVVLQKKR